MAQTNQNTFPDGFPLDPNLAIDFSYFLSDSEKKEWKDWLQSADDDKKKEFVETLHAMWLDNQKSAVPESFNKQQSPQAPTPAQPSPAPSPTPAPKPFPNPAPAPQPRNNFNTQNPSPVVANPQQPTDNKPPKQAVNNANQPSPQKPKDDNESIKLFGQTKYSPNPLLDEDEESQNNEIDNSERKASLFGGGNNNKAKAQSSDQKNSNQNIGNSSNSNNSNNNNNNSSKKEEKKVEPPKAQKPTFKRIRETGIKKALEDIYQQYLDGREKTFTNEREYVENHSIFLDKVMRVVVNFEDVLKYFDSIQEKMLEMNDKIIKQAKEIDKLNNELKEKSDSLEYHLNEIETNLGNTDRELRKNKIELAQKYKEVSEELSSYGADSFKEEGLLYRLDQILDRLESLEQATYKEDSAEKLSIRDRIKKIQSKDIAKAGEENIFKPTNDNQPQKNNQDGLSDKINSFFNQKQEQQREDNSNSNGNNNNQNNQNTKKAGTIDLRGII